MKAAGRDRVLEVLVPAELAQAAEDAVAQALLDFLARHEGEATTAALFGAFVQGARAVAEHTKVALIDHLLERPSPIPEAARAAIRLQVAADYEAARRLVRDEP